MSEETLSHGEARARATRGAVTVFTRHALVRAMAFGGTLVLAYLIDPHTFGLFATAQFLLQLCNALSVGGIVSALVRRQEAVTARDYAIALTLQQVAAAVAFLLVVAVTPMFTRAYDLTSAQALAFPLMCLAVFLMSLRSIPMVTLQRALRHDRVAVSEILEYAVYVLTAIGLAFAGWGLWALVSAVLARYLSSTIYLYLVTRQRLAWGFDAQRAKSLASFAVPLQLKILVEMGQRALATIAVGLIFGPAGAGLMMLALTIMESLVTQPVALLAGIQLRLLARSQGDSDAFAKLLSNCYFMLAAAVGPLLLAAMILAPALLPAILPEAWAGVGWLVPLIAVGSFFQMLAVPSSQALKAMGHVKADLAASVINVTVQASILLLVWDRLGLYGYGIAYASGCGATALYGAWQLQGALGRPLPLGLMFRALVAAFTAAVVALVIGITLTHPWNLPAAAMAALGVYLLGLAFAAGDHVAAYAILLASAMSREGRPLSRALKQIARLAEKARGLFHRTAGGPARG